MMPKKDYDKTLTRLVGILTKLSNGEMPTVKELAQEYGVSVRTIQNDFRERLYNYPIIKTADHRYHFEYGYTLKQTNLNTQELIFLNIALEQFDDIDELDSIKDRIYKKIINRDLVSPYHIKHDDMEDIDLDSALVESLEDAIQQRRIIKLFLSRRDAEVEPYKIVALSGLWYLLARDKTDTRVKTWRLRDIHRIVPTQKFHNCSQGYISEVLDDVHSGFFVDGNSFEVHVKVYPEVADVFREIEFLESQQLREECEDGSVIVSFEVSHDEDVDNIIKAWLPHISVIHPKRFRKKLLKELKEYLQKEEAEDG